MARRRPAPARSKQRAGRHSPTASSSPVSAAERQAAPPQHLTTTARAKDSPGEDLANGTATRATPAEPQALVVCHSFESGAGDAPYDVTIRLTGRRAGGRAVPGAGDTFTHDEVVRDVLPGTGPVSITSWIYGVAQGDWNVTAQVIPAPGTRAGSGTPRVVERATWSWRRWALVPAPEGAIKTRWALLAPLASQPAVIPGVYTALALIGFVVALALQAVVLTSRGLPFLPALTASLAGSIAGLIGAKAWYAVLHPKESIIRGGWAVDGFLVVAPAVAAVTMFVWDQPIGAALDAVAPGIYFAVAIGRVGCFLTGCCAGRWTDAGWGIWSSDRRVGAKRIPAQLFESVAGLVLGVVTLGVALGGGLPIPGALFVGAFVAYAIVRQALLRVRSEQRRVYRTLPLTALAAGLVAILVLALALIQADEPGTQSAVGDPPAASCCDAAPPSEQIDAAAPSCHRLARFPSVMVAAARIATRAGTPAASAGRARDRPAPGTGSLPPATCPSVGRGRRPAHQRCRGLTLAACPTRPRTPSEPPPRRSSPTSSRSGVASIDSPRSGCSCR